MDKLDKVEEKIDFIEKTNENIIELYKDIIQDQKKANKRMFIICICELVMIFAMFVGFLWYESQFEIVGETTTLETGENGIATYLEQSESGDINYGENN